MKKLALTMAALSPFALVVSVVPAAAACGGWMQPKCPSNPKPILFNAKPAPAKPAPKVVSGGKPAPLQAAKPGFAPNAGAGLVAAGGGNLVAAGGGNLVAAGGGNMRR